MPDGELDDVETQTTTVQNPAAAADAIETMSGTVTAFGQTLPAQALKIVTASLSGAIFFFGVLGSYYASTLDEDDDDEYVGPHYILIIILYLLGTVSTVVAMFAPLKGTPLEPHTALIPMVAMGLFWLAFLMAIYGAYFATIDEKGNTWTEYSEMVCVWFGPNSDYCGSFRWTRRFYAFNSVPTIAFTAVAVFGFVGSQATSDDDNDEGGDAAAADVETKTNPVSAASAGGL